MQTKRGKVSRDASGDRPLASPRLIIKGTKRDKPKARPQPISAQKQ